MQKKLKEKKSVTKLTFGSARQLHGGPLWRHHVMGLVHDFDGPGLGVHGQDDGGLGPAVAVLRPADVAALVVDLDLLNPQVLPCKYSF